MTISQTTFDPARVPATPVYRVQLIEIPDTEPALYEVELNGQLVRGIEGGRPIEEARNAGLAAAARRISAVGQAAARVDAIEPDGATWPLIVGARGDRHPVATPAPAKPGLKRSHAVLILAGSLLLSGGAIGGVLVTRPVTSTVVTAPAGATQQSAASPTPAAPKPKPVAAEYPALPPVGASTHARWAFSPLRDDHSFAVGPAGDLYALSGDQLVQVDPDVGRPSWSTEIASDVRGPWVSTVAGLPVLVTSTTEMLTWRPLAHLDQPHNIAYTGTVKFLPGGLYIQTGESTGEHIAELLTADGSLSRRVVPAGATPVGIDRDTLWASDGSRGWKLDSDQVLTPNPIQLKPPKDLARPSEAASWKDGRFLTQWTVPSAGGDSGATYAVLHDTKGRVVKAIRSSNYAPVNNLQDGQVDNRYTVLADGVIDHHTAKLIPLPPAWRTTALVGTDVYGTVNERPARYSLITNTYISTPAKQAATPLGQLGDDTLVAATVNSEPALFLLQRS